MARQTILLIDDDQDIRALMSAFLRHLGFDLIEVENGQLALDWLSKNEKPSLIILDLEMPVMDGREFRKKQLANKKFAKIPVILISSSVDVAKNAKALQVDGYLSKTFDPVRLIKLIKTLSELD